MENKYVRVRGVANEGVVELPLDFDNTLSLAVLCSQFPYSTGLKYISQKTNQIRSIRRAGDKFFLSSELRWDDIIFFCTCSQSKRMELLHPNEKPIVHRKRKSVTEVYHSFPETFDLIALGLSYDTTEEVLDKYLTRFGPTIYCKLSYNENLKESRGIAFFRFKEVKSQNLCLSATHLVDKTKIIIKIPSEKIRKNEFTCHKIYISNLTNSITREDVRVYFSQYGNVIHVYMPSDKRNFAFVTFIDKKSIDLVLRDGQVHVFNGARVNVSLVVENYSNTDKKICQSVIKKRKLSQTPKTSDTMKGLNSISAMYPLISEQIENFKAKQRKLTQNSETTPVSNNPKLPVAICPAVTEGQQYSHHSSPSQIQSPFTHLMPLPDFSQPPPFFNSGVPPPNSLPHTSNYATPIFHSNHSLPVPPIPNIATAPNEYNQLPPFPFQTPSISPTFPPKPIAAGPNEYNQPLQFPPQNTTIPQNYSFPVPPNTNAGTFPNEHNQPPSFPLHLTNTSSTIPPRPTQMESHTKKTENLLDLNLNSSTFQSLVLKEIISQFQEHNYEKIQIEKHHAKSRKSHNQLENLISQVCLLNHEKFQLKNENIHDNHFIKNQSEMMMSHNKIDLPILKDAKVHKALELLQDSTVVDVLLKLSRINTDNKQSKN